MRAFLGLGSNLGDRWQHLRDAVAALDDLGAEPIGEATNQHSGLSRRPQAAEEKRSTRHGRTYPLMSLVAVSPVYETEPVGGSPGQGPYLNCVVELDTELTPRDLLGVAQRLEAAAGRVRDERWGPRTLDVDVLLVGDLVVDEPDLVVPHPRMYERRFVLAPLADLAADLVPPDREGGREQGSVRRVGNL